MEVGGKSGNGIKNGGEGLNKKNKAEGEDLGLGAEPQNYCHYEDPQDRTEEEEVGEKGDKVKAEDEDVEAIEKKTKTAQDGAHKKNADEAKEDGRGKKFAYFEGSYEEVKKVFLPDIFQEGNRDGSLGLTQKIPKNHRSQKDAHHIEAAEVCFF